MPAARAISAVVVPSYLFSKNSFTQTAMIRFFVDKLALVMAIGITFLPSWCKHHKYTMERCRMQ